MKNIFKKFNNKLGPMCTWVAIGAALLLSACGGGSSGSEAGSLNLSSLQGRWITASGDLVGRWLPPSTTTQTPSTFWLLSEDKLFLTVVETTASGGQGVIARGARYRLDQDAAREYIDWNGVANADASPKTISFTNGPALSLQDPLSQPAPPQNAAGQWTTRLNLADLNLTVDFAGLVTGITTTGCQWDGKLTARTDVTMYEVTLKEICFSPQQVETNYSGIGFVSTASDKLTLALETADKLTGKVLYFTRN